MSTNYCWHHQMRYFRLLDQITNENVKISLYHEYVGQELVC